ncbi:flagellar hook-basal body protein [Acetomicrobium mobile DSM 13181]|uniref:Flagellar hook protein FlgE n=1 Tax=Acetomicrobium mobile (strain ATCC BAA-54 / DSM 13181 / JCM 12221 / NGA) TaxID=891968 RepID=I4BUH3_ACEMN|nr:flagellar hook protein FlgE [Acetomicrobium mobile]AFM20930.1 flagellar hook-basal body protein [Acetomicrobium mobile DSM 13181]
MLRSLNSGVSGIRNHQTMLDVIGNNIANVNTAGFKKSIVTFQDLLYETSRGATAPQGDIGGINPMQIGLGTTVAAVETIHSAGPLQYTGNRTDVAIQGDGYFVLNNGSGNVYSRAGNFVLDGNGNIVQSGTGYTVMGYQLTVDPSNPSQYIRGSQLVSLNIPVGQKLSAKATEVLGMQCNLDSRVPAYLPMGLTNPNFTTIAEIGGTAYNFSIAEDTSGTNLLTVKMGNVTVGLKPRGINATTGLPVFDDASVSLGGNTYTLHFDDGTGELQLLDSSSNVAWKQQISGIMDYATLSFKGDDNTTRTYLAEFTDKGDGNMAMTLWGQDSSNNWSSFSVDVPVSADGTFAIPAGGLPIPEGPNQLAGDVDVKLNATGDGKGLIFLASVDNGATYEVASTLNQRTSSIHTTKIDIYDSLGNPHTVEVAFEKIGANEWRWRAWFPSEPGIPISNNTGVIKFDSDGKLTGSGVANVDLGFSSVGAMHSQVKFDFSGESLGKSLIDGVTQFGSDFTTKAYYQDGYAMGVLQDYSIGSDGNIMGVYSNGRTNALYSIALALFPNPAGLEKTGMTNFNPTANSGLPQLVAPGSGGAGTLAGGNLEMSNVDLADEFTKLIIAQRGFQANARVITTSDQVLEELINLKR